MADTAFAVLAVLAERPAHGYDIQKIAHTRGFQFWTRLRKTSIYKALEDLQKLGLVSGREAGGAGPTRVVYRITAKGRARLEHEALAHLQTPSHPRSEIDLGIYNLPRLPKHEALAALDACAQFLGERAAFLEERLAWCRERGLLVPSLAFERPLVALRAELSWIARVRELVASADPADLERSWQHYEFKMPPDPTA